MVYYRGWVVCWNVLVRGRQKSRAKIKKNCGGSINRQRKGKKQGKNVFRTACSLIQISNYPTNVFPLPVKLPFNWSHAFIFPQSWFAFVAGKTPRGLFAISGKESCVDRYLQWWYTFAFRAMLWIPSSDCVHLYFRTCFCSSEEVPTLTSSKTVELFKWPEFQVWNVAILTASKLPKLSAILQLSINIQ